MTWTEYLNLPEGWTAAEYVATVELRGPQDWQYGAIPKPMDPLPKDWWLAQAQVIVKRPRFPMEVASALSRGGTVFVTEDHEHVRCCKCDVSESITNWKSFYAKHQHPGADRERTTYR